MVDLRSLGNVTADLLNNSDFINRSIGMSNSYEDIMFIVQALGREPISLLGKDYLYIFDHVRRNYNMGNNNMSVYHNDCPKFTFYKEKPTVRFANPYEDSKNLLDRWSPDVDFESTSRRNILYSYAESDDDYTNNKEIGVLFDVENANPGVNFGGIASFSNALSTCDMLKKTNDNFNNNKYRTLIARFHTNSRDSKDLDNPTQTAITERFGMSHGRNLLKINKTIENGYDNPYCRVWTYHHQYNQLARAIRPFGDVESEDELEKLEQSGGYNTVGFRTVDDKDFGFKGGSSRLDKYGVLNYKNGLVNIAPTAKIKDYFNGKTDKEATIKKCMFSIENLAWKADNIKMDEYDQLGLSPEQKGPFGGRIMWFPPYDLTFSENVSVDWNDNKFIGRGEKIYTYTNTERTGNLSFTLLIDHPSILDYWTGHKRNGMKDKNGDTLASGNTGSVDNEYNQENTLLRFFAGCEVLTAKPQVFNSRNIKPLTTPDPPAPPVKDPPESDVHRPKTHKVIYCVLYYPNNYSGVDDAPTKGGGTVNAIHYLMNGIGAQKYVDDNKNAVDIPTQIDNKVKVENQYEEPYGGYEIEKNISICETNLKPDYGIICDTYADLQTKEKKAQYLTDENGVSISAKYGDNNSYVLAKIIGSKAMPLDSAKTEKYLTAKPHLWYRRRWYYRVDKAYENDKLSTKDSYLDANCFGLNCNDGYEKIKTTVSNGEKISKSFGLDDADENVTLISFADMFVALEGEKAKNILEDDYDENNVKIIKSIIENNDRFKITSIKFEGHASYQGYSGSNDVLSRNRALTFKKWMQNNKFPNVDSATVGIKKESPKNNVDKGDNSELVVKLWRSSSVKIEYDEIDIENASVAENVKTDSSGEVTTNRTEIPNGTSSRKYLTTLDWLKNSEDGKALLRKYGRVGEAVGINEDGSVRYGIIDPWNFTMEEANRLSGKNYTDPNSLDFDNSYLQLDGQRDITKGIVERYDNEGEFFELLEKNDPFMHHLITDKIRYFDPAYHSISPEGFNARLTFLHQCTRQGSTVGSADNQIGNTAYNLAFGRPPVCVLRLGDFYYTKIIVKSIGIQYEQPQWDLNPEGIGVMPMFAKVNMDFVFLGGSDLSGPISRLQNAVSFNYYANTGVYDNRAEMVEYAPNGSGREVKFKPYSYPDMVHNGRQDRMKRYNSSIDVSIGDNK